MDLLSIIAKNGRNSTAIVEPKNIVTTNFTQLTESADHEQSVQQPVNMNAQEFKMRQRSRQNEQARYQQQSRTNGHLSSNSSMQKIGYNLPQGMEVNANSASTTFKDGSGNYSSLNKHTNLGLKNKSDLKDKGVIISQFFTKCPSPGTQPKDQMTHPGKGNISQRMQQPGTVQHGQQKYQTDQARVKLNIKNEPSSTYSTGQKPIKSNNRYQNSNTGYSSQQSSNGSLNNYRNFSGSLPKAPSSHQTKKTGSNVLQNQKLTSSSTLGRFQQASSMLQSMISNSTGLSGSGNVNASQSALGSGIPIHPKLQKQGTHSNPLTHKKSSVSSRHKYYTQNQNSFNTNKIPSPSFNKGAIASTKIQKFDFINYDQTVQDLQNEKLRIPKDGELEQENSRRQGNKTEEEGNQTPNMLLMQTSKQKSLKLQGKASINKPPMANLQIAIPEDTDKERQLLFDEIATQSFQNGEENLAPSSEKKREKVLNCNQLPKTTGIKTGTHLGQSQTTKNIFLSKFQCNSTRNQHNPHPKEAKTVLDMAQQKRFSFQQGSDLAKAQADQTPKIENKLLESKSSNSNTGIDQNLIEKMSLAQAQMAQVKISSLQPNQRGISQGPPQDKEETGPKQFGPRSGSQANVSKNLQVQLNAAGKPLMDIEAIKQNKYEIQPAHKIIIPNDEPTKTSSKRTGIVRGYAANTNQGLVRNYNEDRVSIITNLLPPKARKDIDHEKWPKCSYFGIYDGHGGSMCADFLRDSLHTFVIMEPCFPANPKEAIIRGFAKAEQAFMSKVYDPQTNTLSDKSGSCAIVVLIVQETCYVANVGDSRAVLSADGGRKTIPLSFDHKPGDEEETERIRKAGGEIYYRTATNQVITYDKEKLNKYQQLNLAGPLRVLPGRLSVARTFGDPEAKIPALNGNPNVIIHNPDVKVFEIKQEHDFIVLGCDGIFDKMQNEEANASVWKAVYDNITHPSVINQAQEVHKMCGMGVEYILKNSLLRRSLDNVTVVVIGFTNFKHCAFGTKLNLKVRDQNSVENVERQATGQLIKNDIEKNKIIERTRSANLPKFAPGDINKTKTIQQAINSTQKLASQNFKQQSVSALSTSKESNETQLMLNNQRPIASFRQAIDVAYQSSRSSHQKAAEAKPPMSCKAVSGNSTQQIQKSMNLNHQALITQAIAETNQIKEKMVKLTSRIESVSAQGQQHLHEAQSKNSNSSRHKGSTQRNGAQSSTGVITRDQHQYSSLQQQPKSTRSIVRMQQKVMLLHQQHQSNLHRNHAQPQARQLLKESRSSSGIAQVSKHAKASFH